jgi:hypothetical protein
MKITNARLKHIIKEEINALLNELDKDEMPEVPEEPLAPEDPVDADDDKDEDRLMKALLNRAGDVRTAWNNQTVKNLLSRLQTQFKIDNLQERVVATIAFGLTMGLNSQEEWNMLMKLARRLGSQLSIKDPDNSAVQDDVATEE